MTIKYYLPSVNDLIFSRPGSFCNNSPSEDDPKLSILEAKLLRRALFFPSPRLPKLPELQIFSVELFDPSLLYVSEYAVVKKWGKLKVTEPIPITNTPEKIVE